MLRIFQKPVYSSIIGSLQPYLFRIKTRYELNKSYLFFFLGSIFVVSPPLDHQWINWHLMWDCKKTQQVNIMSLRLS